jgi:hypothetical protein
MAEAEVTPQDTEEPDTPIEDLQQEVPQKPRIQVALVGARALARARADRQGLEAEEERLAARLLPVMVELELHGIRLEDGTVVRRRFNPNRPTIDPTKLAARCADYAQFVESKVVVDQAALRAAYPSIWTELGGKVKEGVAVYEPKARKGSA